MPAATTTLTRKEWKQFLDKRDRTFFLNGSLREIKVRSIGGGMLEAYSKPWKDTK